MITVRVTERDEQITSLSIKGHSNQAEIGKDLVCAAVSSISIGLLNACDILANECCKLHMGKTIKIDVVQNSDTVQTILRCGVIQLTTVSDEYSDFVEMIKQEV